MERLNVFHGNTNLEGHKESVKERERHRERKRERERRERERVRDRGFPSFEFHMTSL